MSPSRTAALLLNLHNPHSTGTLSFCLPSCSTRSFFARHGTSRGRPTRPRTRHSPVSRPAITPFSTSTRRLREPNHYEALDLPVTATAGEIKKKFYALSLRHHPDRNRKDPNASARFARISSAYNVLGNAKKRSTYDREHGFHQPHYRAPGTHPTGSHSSHSANLHKGSYAGSRPPSGLSKRRGPFRGPPPSFYAQGGYGATGRTSEGSWTAGAGEANQAASGVGGGFASSAGQRKGGYDPEDPTGFIDRNPLGHFDARGHFRTQSAEDARRQERRIRARRSAIRAEDIPRKEGIGIIHFVVVGGMLAFASFTAAFFTSPNTSAKPAGPVASRSAGSGSGSGPSSAARNEEGKIERRRRDETVSSRHEV